MIKQHIWQSGPNGGQTVGVSAGMKHSAWLPLLEQQMTLSCPAQLPASVWHQYPLGRGLVLNRYINDPSGDGSLVMHQLIFDEPADVEALLRSRPVNPAAFRANLTDSSRCDLPPFQATVNAPEELEMCFRTLDKYFAGHPALLEHFLASLTMSARDKRHAVRVSISAPAQEVSEDGRRLMELMLRVLPGEDVLRISYCTLVPPGGPFLQYSVCFSDERAQDAAFVMQDTLFDLTAHTETLPADLPQDGLYAALARALLLHDVEQADRILRGGHAASRRAIAPLADIPGYEPGSSLKQYFADWRTVLEREAGKLNENAFASLAANEWPRLLDAIVTASEDLENTVFLRELCSILHQILREKLDVRLGLSDETLNDMITLLLDSIRWRQIDLGDAKTARLMRTVTAYAHVLPEGECGADCLAACRIISRLLTENGTIQESLSDLSLLEDSAPARFDAVQDLLRRYVQTRLNDEVDVIDERLASAAMLGYARFSDGVPDLRLADKLAERIEARQGDRSARQFRNMTDRVRRHLRPAKADTLHFGDMKLFLFISCLLLGLISGIWIWFLKMG